MGLLENERLPSLPLLTFLQLLNTIASYMAVKPLLNLDYLLKVMIKFAIDLFNSSKVQMNNFF